MKMQGIGTDSLTQRLSKWLRNEIRLLPIYVVISLSLVISHAKAVEHPRGRFARSRDHGNKNIHVTVRPKTIDFYPDDIITVACKARGGNRVEDTTFVSFYRQIEAGHTHIPLSSGDPGVIVEPSIAHETNEHRVKKLLTLGKFAWYTLDYGQNLFYCKATDMDGHSSLSHFFVVKKWHENSHYRGRKRRNPIYNIHMRRRN